MCAYLTSWCTEHDQEAYLVRTKFLTTSCIHRTEWSLRTLLLTSEPISIDGLSWSTPVNFWDFLFFNGRRGERRGMCMPNTLRLFLRWRRWLHWLSQWIWKSFFIKIQFVLLRAVCVFKRCFLSYIVFVVLKSFLPTDRSLNSVIITWLQQLGSLVLVFDFNPPLHGDFYENCLHS